MWRRGAQPRRAGAVSAKRDRLSLTTFAALPQQEPPHRARRARNAIRALAWLDPELSELCPRSL
jgi:hypothetical protein